MPSGREDQAIEGLDWSGLGTALAQSDGTVVFQFEFECRARGADILAYPPVVAGGNRANTLHYVKNNQLIKVHHVLPCCFLPCQALSSLHGSLSLSQQPLFPGAGREYSKKGTCQALSPASIWSLNTSRSYLRTQTGVSSEYLRVSVTHNKQIQKGLHLEET